MKSSRLIVFLAYLVFSCQHEVINFRENWVTEIDELIISYNKQAEIESSKVLKENSEEYHIKFYSKDDKGLQKISTSLNIQNVIDINQEIYLLNNNIIMEKTRGISPLIYKGRKKTLDPCCELFDKLVYYKSSSEGKIYSRKLKMLSTEDKNTSVNELEMMPFKEKEEYDIINEMSSAQEWLDQIKKS